MVASEAGHVAMVRLLLDAGALVNHRDRFGSTALAAAIGGDHPEVVKVLLQRGANPRLEIQGSFCGFADHFLGAASMRRLQIVPILLDGGANWFSPSIVGIRKTLPSRWRPAPIQISAAQSNTTPAR